MQKRKFCRVFRMCKCDRQFLEGQANSLLGHRRRKNQLSSASLDAQFPGSRRADEHNIGFVRKNLALPNRNKVGVSVKSKQNV